jgi:F0F1-type ATP synthase assembly protein I
MSQWRWIGRASTVGIAMVIATGVGYLLGQWADRRWDIEPWGTVVGVLLGAGAGFQQLFEFVRDWNREQEQREKERRTLGGTDERAE